MNQSTFRESVDKIVIAHNQYIDGVWKGTSDLDNPPKTAEAISNLVEEEVKKALESVRDTFNLDTEDVDELNDRITTKRFYE